MAHDEMTRREALKRLTVLVAAAAGVSITDVRELLAAEMKPLAKRTQPLSVLTPETKEALTALIVLLSGKQQVFESHYGRVTPIMKRTINGKQTTQCRTLYLSGSGPRQQRVDGCMTYVMANGTDTIQNALDCTSRHSCNGEEMGPGSRCRGVNTCNGQDCVLSQCPSNNCPNQGCTLGRCSGNGCEDQDCLLSKCDRDDKINISAETMGAFRNDPFVQDLMRQFRTQDMNVIAGEFRNMIETRTMQIRQMDTRTLNQPGIKY